MSRYRNLIEVDSLPHLLSTYRLGRSKVERLMGRHLTENDIGDGRLAAPAPEIGKVRQAYCIQITYRLRPMSNTRGLYSSSSSPMDCWSPLPFCLDDEDCSALMEEADDLTIKGALGAMQQ